MATFPGLKFCDINLRKRRDLDLVKQIARTADILESNESEFAELTGEAAINEIFTLGLPTRSNPSFPKRLCVTFGDEGALYFTENHQVYFGTAEPVEVVDSIGTGEALMAGLINQWVSGEHKRLKIFSIIVASLALKRCLVKVHVRWLKPTCAKTCVPARNPLGHVVFYAPALACRLHLSLHHIVECRKLGTPF